MDLMQYWHKLHPIVYTIYSGSGNWLAVTIEDQVDQGSCHYMDLCGRSCDLKIARVGPMHVGWAIP